MSDLCSITGGAKREHLLISSYIMYWISILFFLQLTHAQDACEGVFCFCEPRIAICRNVPTFPQFLSTNVMHLTIISSQITRLDITQLKFPVLQELVLRSCEYITCEEIERVKIILPNIKVDSDIDCATATSEIIVSTTTTTVVRSSRSYTDGTAATSSHSSTRRNSDLTSSGGRTQDTLATVRNTGYTVQDYTMTSTSYATMGNLSQGTSKHALPQYVIAILVTVLILVIALTILIIGACAYSKTRRNRVERLCLDNLNYTGTEVYESTTI